jgi:hypothetical protein
MSRGLEAHVRENKFRPECRFAATTLPAKPQAAGGRSASETLRSGGLVARARSAHQQLTCRRLFERSGTK